MDEGEDQNESSPGEVQREMMALLSQETRHSILMSILGHPHHLTSRTEIEEMVSKSSGAIDDALQKLQSEGIIAKYTIDEADNPNRRDYPTTFWGPTAKGIRILHEYNYLRLVPAQRALYDSTELSDTMARHLAADRPNLPGEITSALAFDEESNGEGSNSKQPLFTSSAESEEEPAESEIRATSEVSTDSSDESFDEDADEHQPASKPSQSIEEAVSEALEKTPNQSFRETVDLAINLRDINLNDPSNRVEESVVLPSGTGQETRIVVFATGETAVRAEDVADEVLGPDELKDLGDDDDEAKELAANTDFFLAEAAMMEDIGRYLGTVLGPRGKMPTPLQPDDDVVETVERMKNTVQLRSRDRRTLEVHVGGGSMSPQEISDNIDVILGRLESSLLEKKPTRIESLQVRASEHSNQHNRTSST
jgi:large subunit ribosomal protein L1